MAWPPDCVPGFNYKDHPDYPQKLRQQTKETLVRLRRGITGTASIASDPRPAHGRMFYRLTPARRAYYAGHYRGESYRCLTEYPVRVRSDPRVGKPPWAVLSLMHELADGVRAGLAALDEQHQKPASQVSPEMNLYMTVALACAVFERFLLVHPFADGNGHAARFVVWAVLGRYGYWPDGWPIDPQPDPPYIQLIVEYRTGNRQPLEDHIMSFVKTSSNP